MAKMMMGQIDHARKRVAELKAEKLGGSPDKPVIQGGRDVLEDIREGRYTVTATKLRVAFEAFMNEVVSKTVSCSSGGYPDYSKTYSIDRIAPENVQDALASIVYEKENNAEIRRWELDTELYTLRKEALNLKASEVEDAIVLGDQQAALRALQDFAAFTP